MELALSRVSVKEVNKSSLPSPLKSAAARGVPWNPLFPAYLCLRHIRGLAGRAVPVNDRPCHKVGAVDGQGECAVSGRDARGS
jgi:hypothetical protein